MDLTQFPLVETAVLDLMFEQGGTTDQNLKYLQVMFDRKGPYETAKKFNLLKNGSGEDFAVQFMSLWNSVYPGTY